MNKPELRVELEFFCGCGDPVDAARTLLKILEMHPMYQGWDQFNEMVPGSGLQYLVLYMLDSVTSRGNAEGWFEHGGSIGGQWLTPKGEEVRDALRRESEDDFEALFADGGWCIHGYTGDEDHDCMKAVREEEKAK